MVKRLLNAYSLDLILFLTRWPVKWPTTGGQQVPSVSSAPPLKPFGFLLRSRPLKEAADAEHWQAWGSGSVEKSLLVTPLGEPHAHLERTVFSASSVSLAQRVVNKSVGIYADLCPNIFCVRRVFA